MSEPIVCLNGNFIPFREAQLPIFDLGIVQGATLTERLRTFHHRPYQLAKHLQRLQQTMLVLGWKLPQPPEQFLDNLQAVAAANAELIAAEEDLSVVAFITGGDFLPDSNGYRFSEAGCTTCLYTSPLPLTKYARWYTQGICLVTPETKQIPRECLDPRMKTRSRMHWYLADRQARAQNPEAMALLLDQRGFVTETSSGNLFVVQNGRLLTPRDETTLPGIAQQKVVDLARKLSLPVERADLTPDQIFHEAEEAFLTSSTYCLAPVVSLNGVVIGSGVPGPVTGQLQRVWGDEVGLDFVSQALRAASLSKQN